MFMKISQPQARDLEIARNYGLDPERLLHLRRMEFSPREQILTQGDRLSALLLVLSGKSKVCSLVNNGKNLILNYFISHGIIGDIELMTTDKIISTTQIALSEFHCLLIPLAKNEVYLKGNIIFMNHLAEELAQKLLSSSRNYLSAAFCSGEQRLSAYILETAYKDYFADNLVDVAATIGLSYRQMFRLLNRLLDAKIIERYLDGFRILDAKRLRQEAGAEPEEDYGKRG